MKAKKKLSLDKKILLGTYVVFISVAGIFMVQSFLYTPNPFLIIISDSMIPALQIGDIVVIEAVQPHEIQKGDIIAYKPRIVTVAEIQVHRVQSTDYEADGHLFYITKGDANQNIDGFPLTYDDVLGRVAFKIPYIANVFSLFQNPFVLIGIVFLVFRKFI